MQIRQIYYSRIKTREVAIGNIPLGGSNPIRIQTMTNTSTKDVKGTVEQCKRAINAGAEYVRITVPAINDVEFIASIKENLRKSGYNNPIIADVHFNPKIAELVAGVVEKVRINPGNYADKKDFKTINYTDIEYQEELKKAEEQIIPLLEISKQHGTTLRIGVNHGSLSDRIMSRYGDTPMGMAESAMEFVRIISKAGYANLVISMKSSNARVMVQATRLVVDLMQKENYFFPIHLGVTEAGEGEDGRIKSAVGIGALLAEGIGDTLRVSLTEDPEFEIPVAQKLVKHFSGWDKISVPVYTIKQPVNPFEFKKRETTQVIGMIGGHNVPVVVADSSRINQLSQKDLKTLGWNLKNTGWNFSNLNPDFIYASSINSELQIPENKGIIVNFQQYQKANLAKRNIYPLFDCKQYMENYTSTDDPKFLKLSVRDITDELLILLEKDTKVILVMEPSGIAGLLEHRSIFNILLERKIKNPAIIKRQYNCTGVEDFQIAASADTGPLFLDGLGDGLWLSNNNSGITHEQLLSTAFSILQASRVRTTRTEYISCPGCGRTLYDLQSTVKKIREKTTHLKGLKIGIMGCIVNGPGEMADADYGYVGAGRGKVNLYKAQKLVRKDISEEHAVEALIQLIKDSGDWPDKLK